MSLLLFLKSASGPDGRETSFTPFTFGAKFEPPEGRIVHGMGQWPDDNRAYLDMLADTDFYPLTELFFFDLEPARPWDMVLEQLRLYLDRQKRLGRLPNLNLGMSGPDKESVEWWKSGVWLAFGVDDKIAHTAQYDSRIQDVALILRDHGTPAFLRIGGEFNGGWNGHHPFDYPLAFRKIVQHLRGHGADNVAFLWCYEPSAANDFDATDDAGRFKWFPGNDVIDWYSLDVFARRDFSDAYPEYERGIITPKGKSERFLRMAQDHGRPVMIAESSVVDFDIASEQVWDEWFQPYFNFLAAHPQVKAFVYINADWPRYRPHDPFGWLDGRVTENPVVASLYVEELSEQKYLHAPDAATLKDFDQRMSIPRQPLEFTGIRAVNRSLSQMETVNVLTWKVNPGNQAVLKYRVYEIREGETYLLSEVKDAAMKYIHRRVDDSRAYHYSITAVDSLGVEGLAALLTVQ
ncbi:MAG: hypothetical protein A2Y56_09845 [Candidatus Aminicenantes bacterium RBG_13_63_10]|nr:MAG: hypothetical protein A2Y56_09845 [Candidatus Aminicenantes bacterium RBG_13_63_10]